MKTDDGASKPSAPHFTDRAPAAQEERRAREAKALRANLLRRKQQQRARPEGDGPASD
ncbi:hypothetical protein [Gluconobacter morbifer]|uniref:Uncharacterized protein n=1 Tax=Gluconobacter morbifer G707 TaxID=1088869 RepID=G6XK00_9PROT|nr:hypothetical protein [Gluconobacter morbifer]EHH67962.1 hypothetical protein GMO_17290 [Gluconobacter morbifer G707]